MNIKTALITGITGQDGSYLAEQLLEKDYEVYGLIRRTSTPNYINIEHILDDITLLEGDLTDSYSIDRAVDWCQPDEVYNLGAQSFVGTSWKQPIMTSDVTGLGCARVLNAVKEFVPDAKFYQASSSEMFGKVQESPQSETTPFYPRSPYGVSKLYAYWMTKNYRESYDMFACNAINFNNESQRRGIEFVTRKITNGVARCFLGIDSELALGNLDSKRDWGFAGDYMDAAWRMLQKDVPDDYVISTGETHSIREFCEIAFGVLDMDWQKYVTQDPRFMRPAEVDLLLGDSSKAAQELGWEPTVSFKQLITNMVLNDLEIQRKEK